MQPTPLPSSGWRATPPPSATPMQQYWLLRPGALTAGLRKIGDVQLRVSREYAQGLPESEAWMLARSPREAIWVREIMMRIDGTDAVFARSFTPLHASHGRWQRMRRLRTRPLADMLYNNPEITRSSFSVARVRRQMPLYFAAEHILGAGCPHANRILARCSTFWRAGEPLLVAEGFLPGFWPLAARSLRAQGLSLRNV